jgi:hypothetical protein
MFGDNKLVKRAIMLWMVYIENTYSKSPSKSVSCDVNGTVNHSGLIFILLSPDILSIYMITCWKCKYVVLIANWTLKAK